MLLEGFVLNAVRVLTLSILFLILISVSQRGEKKCCSTQFVPNLYTKKVVTVLPTDDSKNISASKGITAINRGQ